MQALPATRPSSSPAVAAASAAPPAAASAAKARAVAVFDLNLDAAEKVAAAIRAEGGRAQAFSCDITDRASVDAAVAAAETTLGPDRRAGQQRRLGRLQALHQDRAGAVGQADRHQPDRRAAHAPRGAARHGGAQEGPHRQHRVRCGARRLLGRGGLRRLQGRPGGVLQDHRPRACAPRHHRQRRLPRADRHRAVRRLQGRRRQPREADGSVHALDPAGPHRPARRPARRDRCSSPATTPPSSPARC